jgi:hypothetical protein
MFGNSQSHFFTFNGARTGQQKEIVAFGMFYVWN